MGQFELVRAELWQSSNHQETADRRAGIDSTRHRGPPGVPSYRLGFSLVYGNEIDTRELLSTEAELAMTDTSKGETRVAEEALNLAKRAVDSATAQVDEVSRHFSDAVEKARQRETYLELLRKATMVAPIGMLVMAFVAGALFGSRGYRR